MPARALKDALIGSTVDILLLLIILMFISVRKMSAYETSIYFAKFFVLVALISSVFGLLFLFGTIEWSIGSFTLGHSPSFGRMHGYLGEPSHFGSLAGVGVVCASYLMSLGSGRKYVIMIVFLLIMLLMSGSRNGIVSTVCSLSAILVFGYRIRGFGRVLGIILVIGIGLLLVDINFGAQISSFLVEVFRLNDVVGTSIRLRIWPRVINIYSELSIFHMLFGHGYGYVRQVGPCAFNTYLEYLVNYGIVFVMLFVTYVCWLFWILLRNMRRETTRPAALFAAMLLVYSLVFSTFLVTIFTSFFHIVNFIFICSIIITAKIVDSQQFGYYGNNRF